MTLLDSVRNAAAIIGLPLPVAVVNNNDPTVATMLALANREGRALARMRNAWGSTWTVLEREFVFSTVNGQDEYDLPADFYSVIGNSVWDRGNFFPVRGGISAQEWQAIRSGLVQSAQLRRRYRITRTRGAGANRKFFLDPTPEGDQPVVFEYASDRWVQNAAGTLFTDSFRADDDVSLLPEDLIERGITWRYLSRKGFDYTSELAEYEIEVKKYQGSDWGPTKIPVARNRFVLPVGNVPDSGFGPSP